MTNLQSRYSTDTTTSNPFKSRNLFSTNEEATRHPYESFSTNEEATHHPYESFSTNDNNYESFSANQNPMRYDYDSSEDEDYEDDYDSYYRPSTPIDMSEKLKELNKELAEEIIPADSVRQTKLRFKDVIAEYASPRYSDSDDGYGDSSEMVYDAEDENEILPHPSHTNTKINKSKNTSDASDVCNISSDTKNTAQNIEVVDDNSNTNTRNEKSSFTETEPKTNHSQIKPIYNKINSQVNKPHDATDNRTDTENEHDIGSFKSSFNTRVSPLPNEGDRTTLDNDSNGEDILSDNSIEENITCESYMGESRLKYATDSGEDFSGENENCNVIEVENENTELENFINKPENSDDFSSDNVISNETVLSNLSNRKNENKISIFSRDSKDTKTNEVNLSKNTSSKVDLGQNSLGKHNRFGNQTKVTRNNENRIDNYKSSKISGDSKKSTQIFNDYSDTKAKNSKSNSTTETTPKTNSSAFKTPNILPRTVPKIKPYLGSYAINSKESKSKNEDKKKPYKLTEKSRSPEIKQSLKYKNKTDQNTKYQTANPVKAVHNANIQLSNTYPPQSQMIPNSRSIDLRQPKMKKAASTTDIVNMNEKEHMKKWVYENWLSDKNKQAIQRKKESEKKNREKESDMKIEIRRKNAEAAFEQWLKRKTEQLRLEKRLKHQKRRDISGSTSSNYDRTKDMCDQAYKEWCKRKHEEMKATRMASPYAFRSSSLDRTWNQERTRKIYSSFSSK